MYVPCVTTRFHDGLFGGRCGNRLEDGVATIIVIIAVLQLVFQIIFQAEIVIVCATTLSLPPYFDKHNRDLANDIAMIDEKASEKHFEAAATALGLPVQALTENTSLRETYDKQHAGSGLRASQRVNEAHDPDGGDEHDTTRPGAAVKPAGVPVGWPQCESLAFSFSREQPACGAESE